MKVAVLFSGGKDSTYALFKAGKEGHQIKCLINIIPYADDSPYFHYPNSWLVDIISKLTGIPLLQKTCNSVEKQKEIEALAAAVKEAKDNYEIEGVVHGGLSSIFQGKMFSHLCAIFHLKSISPLWKAEPLSYMNQLLLDDFTYLIVGVSANGLDSKWLGKLIDHQSLRELEDLSRKYKFNISFEGGEAETLVIDCPLYSKKIQIEDFKTTWDGQRGTFEILAVSILSKE